MIFFHPSIIPSFDEISNFICSRKFSRRKLKSKIQLPEDLCDIILSVGAKFEKCAEKPNNILDKIAA